jgi:hypothetical protein
VIGVLKGVQFPHWGLVMAASTEAARRISHGDLAVEAQGPRIALGPRPGTTFAPGRIQRSHCGPAVTPIAQAPSGGMDRANLSTMAAFRHGRFWVGTTGWFGHLAGLVFHR